MQKSLAHHDRSSSPNDTMRIKLYRNSGSASKCCLFIIFKLLTLTSRCFFDLFRNQLETAGCPKKKFRRLMEDREKVFEPNDFYSLQLHARHFNLKFGISWEEVSHLKWNHEL